MNLNQAAHGDRESGSSARRMRLNRKVIVGHWQDAAGAGGARRLGARRRAPGTTAQGAKIARFGDNMREVAVTEGDKVEAQISLGYSVNGYGVGDLVATRQRGHRRARSTRLVAEYDATYTGRQAAAQGRRAAANPCARPRASSWACGPS